jgi:hypothetical protein
MRILRLTTKVLIVVLDEKVKFPEVKLFLDFIFSPTVLRFCHAARVLVKNLKFFECTLEIANVLELVSSSFVLGQGFLNPVRIRESFSERVEQDLVFWIYHLGVVAYMGS